VINVGVFWEFIKLYITINQLLTLIFNFFARNGYFSRIWLGATRSVRTVFSHLRHLLFAVHAQMSHRELPVHSMHIVYGT
jgi:hypothetical protein